MLRADLHVHSRFSPDSSARPEDIIARCLSTGINCIALTDHNTIAGALDIQHTSPIMVIVGEEVSTTGGDIVGLFLTRPVPAGLSPLEAAVRIKDQGGLVMLPHPFDNFRNSVGKRGSLKELLPYVDIVEAFNAHILLMGQNHKAAELAKAHGLPMAAVSDAHAPGEIGPTYVEMPEFDGTPDGLLDSLRQGRLVGRMANPLGRLSAKLSKVGRLFR